MIIIALLETFRRKSFVTFIILWLFYYQFENRGVEIITEMTLKNPKLYYCCIGIFHKIDICVRGDKFVPPETKQ